MGTILKVLQLVLGILPQVIELIKAVEVPGNGADKKSLVLDLVLTTIKEFAPGAGIEPSKVGSFTEKVIDTIVSFLNKVGVFKK